MSKLECLPDIDLLLSDEFIDNIEQMFNNDYIHNFDVQDIYDTPPNPDYIIKRNYRFSFDDMDYDSDIDCDTATPPCKQSESKILPQLIVDIIGMYNNYITDNYNIKLRYMRIFKDIALHKDLYDRDDIEYQYYFDKALRIYRRNQYYALKSLKLFDFEKFLNDLSCRIDDFINHNQQSLPEYILINNSMFCINLCMKIYNQKLIYYKHETDYFRNRITDMYNRFHSDDIQLNKSHKYYNLPTLNSDNLYTIHHYIEDLCIKSYPIYNQYKKIQQRRDFDFMHPILPYFTIDE